MTSPIQPNVDPSAPPVASVAPGSAVMDEEIRQLAAALAPESSASLSGRKAVIEAVSLGDGSTPPTVTVNLGGVSIPDIRLAASYTPTVGDTVILVKQANEFFAAFKIQDIGSKSEATAGGWIQPSLASGNSHETGVYYRRVMQDGSWKMQWKGRFNYGNSTVLASALDAEYRPSATRSVTGGRPTSLMFTTVRLDFTTGGNITVVGASGTIDLGSSFSAGGWSIDHSHGGSTGFTDPPGDGFANSHAHSIPSTTLSSGSHSHDLGTISVSSPAWVSLDGVEYFL